MKYREAKLLQDEAMKMERLHGDDVLQNSFTRGGNGWVLYSPAWPLTH
jgi:hypothetical protein